MLNEKLGTRIVSQQWLCGILYAAFVFTLFVAQILQLQNGLSQNQSALTSSLLSALTIAFLTAAISHHKDILARLSDERSLADSMLLEITEHSKRLLHLCDLWCSITNDGCDHTNDSYREIDVLKSLVFNAAVGRIGLLPRDSGRLAYVYFVRMESVRDELSRLPTHKDPQEEFIARGQNLGASLAQLANDAANAIEKLSEAGASAGARSDLAIENATLIPNLRKMHGKIIDIRKDRSGQT